MAITKNSSSSNSKTQDDQTQAESRNNNVNLSRQILEMLPIIVNLLLLLLKVCWLIGKAIIELISPVTPKSVKGEIVLITGAASGIGRELALEYASEGATVVCWDINEKENLETVEEIASLGYPKAYAYVCNVANREVMEVAEMVQKDVGDVTILINNAAALRILPFLDHTSEDIQTIMNVNTLQAFLSTMVKNNYGHIVAVSSLAGLIGITRNLTAYCTSKFALRGMMEALYNDLHVDSKCQIKTTCVYPAVAEPELLDMKRVHIKYPKIMPILKSKYVAECIMNAQRRDMFEVTVPHLNLESKSVVTISLVCDVANREEVMEVAKKVQNDVGDVTILINNAGLMPHRPFLDHTPEVIQRIMNINVMAHFWTLEAFLPAMIKNNYGHIVAVSSAAGLVGVRNLTPYCASKFAVRGMMEALYHDLHVDPKCQIKLTLIYPFATETGLFNVKDIQMKYPKLTPIMKPKHVAEYIMNAQRRDMFETTVPRHLLTLQYCMRLLPTTVIMAGWDSADSFIESDVKQKI